LAEDWLEQKIPVCDAAAALLLPPTATEFCARAWRDDPPIAVEKTPEAVLDVPPITVASDPVAQLKLPPTAVDALLVALMPLPPTTAVYRLFALGLDDSNEIHPVVNWPPTARKFKYFE
jgi:hypothetical protein